MDNSVLVIVLVFAIVGVVLIRLFDAPMRVFNKLEEAKKESNIALRNLEIIEKVIISNNTSFLKYRYERIESSYKEALRILRNVVNDYQAMEKIEYVWARGYSAYCLQLLGFEFKLNKKVILHFEGVQNCYESIEKELKDEYDNLSYAVKRITKKIAPLQKEKDVVEGKKFLNSFSYDSLDLIPRNWLKNVKRTRKDINSECSRIESAIKDINNRISSITFTEEQKKELLKWKFLRNDVSFVENNTSQCKSLLKRSTGCHTIIEIDAFLNEAKQKMLIVKEDYEHIMWQHNYFDKKLKWIFLEQNKLKEKGDPNFVIIKTNIDDMLGSAWSANSFEKAEQCVKDCENILILNDKGDKIMGDQYNIEKVSHSQMAIGSGNQINNSSIEQNNGLSNFNMTELIKELEEVRSAMENTPNKNSQQYSSIAEISQAEDAAKSGNQQAVWEHLKKSGTWAFDIATKIGVSVAASALKSALGL
ncbi:MAG: hypothetical protein DWQ04_28420 [Chloroflexi bacterium]|nr:MAG: hypothetical protein DWQ04_28420 [Chloroflexota bacterium]